MEEDKEVEIVGKPRIKSRTNQAALVIALLGVLETNMGMMRELLGDYYGLTYVLIGAIMVILREVTKEPVR